MARNYTLSLELSTKEFAYRTGVRFRGLTISQTQKGYNVILRGLRPSGQAVYAMASHTDPSTGLSIVLGMVTAGSKSHAWHPDKYYKGGVK